MTRSFGCTLAFSLVLLLAPARAPAAPRWLTLPPTPALPRAAHPGHFTHDGARLWYATLGQGAPILLLHGGLANAGYLGDLAAALAADHRVVLMDSRGHGRSTRDARPFSYDVMAADVVALLDHLGIAKAAIVGWSDGAILGLLVAIRHPERMSRLFAFAANTDPSGVADASGQPVVEAYLARTAKEYAALSETPDDYEAFKSAVTTMWATQPHITREELRGISTPTWIVDGDHDEMIRRENTELMAAEIPVAGLLILPTVGHFGFLQAPGLFTDAVRRFLAEGGSGGTKD
jgi:pimeloyl-ACP methyl ester carboxylesterase